MMSRTRKNYSSSFKAKVALTALREDEPILELALKYGVHATVIHCWKHDALASMEAGYSERLEKIYTGHDAHLHELHAKSGQPSVERDFLLDTFTQLGLGVVKIW
jgi:transposase